MTEEQRQRNKERTKLWVKNNKARHLRKQKEYRENNKEKRKEAQQRWSEENREQKLAGQRRWRLANLDKMAAYERKRRSQKAGVGHEKYGDIDIFERDNWICGICGQKINKRLKYPDPRSKSIDHIIALSRGGADAAINLQAAHRRCNMGKGNRGGGQMRLIG